MIEHSSYTRRRVAQLAAVCVLVPMGLAARKRVPIALQIYSLRDEAKRDVIGTIRDVAKLGYEGVEFYSPYLNYTEAQVKEIRRTIDETGLKYISAHTAADYFTPEKLPRAIEVNQMLGSKSIIQVNAPGVETLDGWRIVAERLSAAAAKVKPLGMRVGYHNHAVEFKPVDGKFPWAIIAENTPKDVILQLDLGTAASAGADPLAWLKKYPGRCASMHLKDYSPDPALGMNLLPGDGVLPLKAILTEAEKSGGVECYIAEQGTAGLPPLEAMKQALERWRKLQG